MDSLPGYDAYKLDTPPEYDLPDEEICECGYPVSRCQCDNYDDEDWP